MKVETWESHYSVVMVGSVACHVPMASYMQWTRLELAMLRYGKLSDVRWFIHCHGRFGIDASIRDIRSYWVLFWSVIRRWNRGVK